MSASVAPSAIPNGTDNKPPSTLVAFRDNLNIHLICPDCRQDPPDLVEEDADTICGNCGRVLQERLVSYESEWRTFNTDEKGGEDPNRVGDQENSLLFGNAGTQIGGGGANVSKDTRRLKKAQAMQNEDKDNRALLNAYNTLEGWADRESIGNVVKESAKEYYKQVYEKNFLRGKPLPHILAGCLFIACRTNNVARSFADLVNLTRVPKKEIGRTYKALNRFFTGNAESRAEKIEQEGGIVNKDAIGYIGTQSSRPADLVPRFCNMLGTLFRVQAIAVRLAEQVSSFPDLAGRSPLSTAGACIYFASHLLGRGKTYGELSSVINVSDATIKAAYKNLLRAKDSLIQPEWLGPQQVNVREGGPPAIGDLKNLPSS